METTNTQYYLKRASLYNLFQVGGVAILTGLFFYLYPTFLVERYAYMGFSMVPLQYWKLVFSSGLFFFSFVYIFSKASPFLKSVSLFFQVIFLLPNLVFYNFNDISVIPICGLTLLIALLSFPRIKFRPIQFVKPEFIEITVLIFTLLLPVLFIVLYTYPLNFNLELLKFGKAIYAVRETNAEVVHSSFLSYTLSPLVKVLLPLFVLFMLHKKKYFLSLLGVVVIAALFFITAKKGVFFGLVLVLFFSMIKDYKKQASLFVLGLSLVIILGTILSSNGNLMLNSLIVRRVFFLPAWLNWAYLDFFTGENLYYGYSFLGSVVPYNLDAEPAVLIGREYFYTGSGYANNGFISDALINIGVPGMVLVILLIVWMFRFFDSLNLGPSFFGIFFVFLFALLSTGFFTVMFTHGGLWLIALTYLVSRSIKKESNLNQPYNYRA